MINNNQSIWMVSNLSETVYLPFKVEVASFVDDLPKQPPYAVVLTKAKHQSWLPLLRDLRENKDYRYIPAFYHGHVDKRTKLFFDGSAEDDVLSMAHEIHQQCKKISPFMQDKDDLESKLLCYLFSRPQAKLMGCINPHESQVYEYPLLSILDSSGEIIDYWQFLEDLVLRDLLRQGELIDEIKICGNCHSGLLNLKNLCPNCHSISVKKQSLINCLSCGKKGPIAEFMHQGKLHCRTCQLALVKEGIDFDKPDENQVCLKCGHFFCEGETKLSCLLCHKISEIKDLEVRQLYDYELTRRAEHLVQGIEKELFQGFNHHLKVIDYLVFMAIIGWQVKLAERYTNWHFSIMTLKILNENQMIEEKGAVSTERIIGKFYLHLRQIFRETDLSSRNAGNMFFFLPLTEHEGCQALMTRIKDYLEKQQTNGLSIGLSYLTSFELINGQLEGDFLTTELQARMREENSLFLEKNAGSKEN